MALIRKGGVVVAAFLAACPLTVSSAQAGQGFAGQWAATDGDGSALTLAIRGAGVHYAVRELDDAATVCGGAPAAVNGAGKAEGTLLVVGSTLTCLPGGNIFRHRIEITFRLDPTADTLTDNDGVVWTRQS